MRYIYLPVCIATLILCGCDKSAKSTEEKEESNQLVKTGQSYMEIKNWDKAEEAFKQALENDPTLARPHLDLAMIYQQYKVNPIHAIYHYDRYLELNPGAEKADFINEQKVKVAQTLANSLISSSPEVKKVVDELKRLQQENATLKRQLAGSGTPAAPVPPRSITPATTPSVQPTGTATPQIYRVVEGDTLSKIASKYYGDSSQWDVIFEANKSTMKSAGDLRVGQTLVIPKQ
jgi:LysM repeat protein